MPNIFHQSVEDILKAATPEQKILWNYIFLRYGERVSISQLCFTGSLAGELLAYNANKLYLAYQLEFTAITAIQVAPSYLRIYSPANAVYFVGADVRPVWDATAAAMRYQNNNYSTKNILFSRLEGGVADQINFIGYRLTF